MKQWPWFKSLRIKHKYAINSQYLGDNRILAWSNLGYWDQYCTSYVQACGHLADRLAKAVHLCADDRLLDLGCGQGASLVHWQKQYQIHDLSAVELQTACIQQIQQYLDSVHLYQISFLQLDQLDLTEKFDVVLCIDAAYHSPLALFLDAILSVLNINGRIGFHYLVLSDQFQQLSQLKQQYYRYLLRAVDVDLDQLGTRCAIQQRMYDMGFRQVEITDISQPVLAGFAQYIQQIKSEKQHNRLNIDYLKITMTAHLCQLLYRQGMLRYIEVAAQRQT